MAVRDALLKIVENRALHARWLNSLSYLEYRGFRKIARAIPTEEMDCEILTHAMEEVRHAVHFKRLAMKVGGSDYSTYRDENMLAAKAVKAYFYDLDQMVVSELQDLRSAEALKAIYCFVTWLIEERAMSVYAEYNTILKQNGFEFSLDSILREEDRHLEEMAAQGARILSASGIDHTQLIRKEHEIFARMWTAIETMLTARELTL